MHTTKITPNLLFEYQCTSGKFIRLPNRIESKLYFSKLECSIGYTQHVPERGRVCCDCRQEEQQCRDPFRRFGYTQHVPERRRVCCNVEQSVVSK